MDSLGRYPLSVILSYLTETEGTCLLITRRSYAKKWLPLFRMQEEDASSKASGEKKKKKHRHHFVAYHTQDAWILLDRMNTVRLHRRSKQYKVTISTRPNMSTHDMAIQEWNFQKDKLEFPYTTEYELLRFLDPSHEMHGKEAVLLASYPRSGNSMCRSMIEKVTGIVTGSDLPTDKPLSIALSQSYGLVGEGIVDSSQVAFIKTHWPTRPGIFPFDARKVLILVRNPFDVIDSYWNLCITNTHTLTVTDEIYQQHRTKFEGLVRNEIEQWWKFIHYYTKARPSTLPGGIKKEYYEVLIVRYEDLILQTGKEMERIVNFHLGKETASGEEVSAFWKRRIQHALGESVDKMGCYKPRHSTVQDSDTTTTNAGAGADAQQSARAARAQKSIGKSLRKGRYPDELLKCFASITQKLAAEFSTPNYFVELGYDLDKSNFPHNFHEQSPPCPLGTGAAKAEDACFTSTTINKGKPIRAKDDPYGRAMHTFRQSLTDGDHRPLPTVPR